MFPSIYSGLGKNNGFVFISQKTFKKEHPEKMRVIRIYLRNKFDQSGMSKDPCNQNFCFYTFDCSSDLTLCLSKGNYQEYKRVQMHSVLLENQTMGIILVKSIMSWTSVPLSTQWPFIFLQDLCNS